MKQIIINSNVEYISAVIAMNWILDGIRNNTLNQEILLSGGVKIFITGTKKEGKFEFELNEAPAWR